MKKFYTLALCGLMGISAVNAANRFQSRKEATKQIKKIEANAPLWRAESVSEYYFDEDEEEWILMATTTYTYDNNGYLLSEQTDSEGELSRVTYTRDAFGNPVQIIESYLDGDQWVMSGKRDYTYDQIVPGLVTKRMGYDYMDGEWVENYYCEINEVTRNDDNNILEIEKSLLGGSTFIPAYKLMWNYDETTGKANEYYYYANYAYAIPAEWELLDGTCYKNVVWETTNGQMTEADIFDYVTGDNKIKSADVYYEDEIDGHYFVEYTEGKPEDYLIKETFANPEEIGRTRQMVVTDSYGSTTYTESEYFDEEQNACDEPTYTYKEVTTKDEHGNTILIESYEAYEGDEPELVQAIKVDYLYDENGNPTEMESSWYDPYEDIYYPDMKIIYGTYIDASGVESVAAEKNTDAPVEYFDLQGRRVANPSNGVYIRRQGTAVSKVILN